MYKRRRVIALAFTFSLLVSGVAAPGTAARAEEDPAGQMRTEIDARSAKMENRLIAWRRDIHQHPELSNREIRTAKLVADHLRSVGIEVRTGVAHTGVVGLLRGSREAPVVALRADMDALPVTEETDLPFASKIRASYEGREVGVMHACGHDLHVAILMGVAEVLAGLRQQLPGSVKFIFQPAEEGPPEGEKGGAELMIKEGALENPKPEAIFGLHVFPLALGRIEYRPGGAMAASDILRISVRGRQTHGARPWLGVDPIVVASQIVLALQTITSRQIDVAKAPGIVTIASIHGGLRHNIIPDQVEMLGSIRSFDPRMQEDIHARIRRTAELTAQSAGATAEVAIIRRMPVTYNDPGLAERMRPTLIRVAGEDAVSTAVPATVSEDFSLYEQQLPGLFFFLGITPKGVDPEKAESNHSPRFYADEGALVVGVRALANLAADYLVQASRN
jgi:amidohydrolase